MPERSDIKKPVSPSNLPTTVEPPGYLPVADGRFDALLPTVFGRYRILERLGRGGMGAVYAAQDTKLNRRVALKVPLIPQGNAVLRERFLREAQALAAFDHPHLCRVYDVDELNHVLYYTMPFIKGQLLSSWIKPEKPLPQKQVAILVHKLASALAFAHDKGIIHRDLKPANIMIRKSADKGMHEPIIMDFGLARREQDEDLRLTKSGATMGTIPYMSPEQLKGDTAKIGPGCDIYSLGALLYELLTGRLPLERKTAAERQAAILRDAPPDPCIHRPDLDVRLAAICLKCLAKEPGERYSSMKELAAKLAELNAKLRRATEKQVDTVIPQATPRSVARLPPSQNLLSPEPERLRHWIPADQVQQIQKAWAQYLGRKVEERIDLGGGVSMTMVLVPPGSFMMGGCESLNEQPLHGVTITRPLFLCKDEVTQQQYQHIVGTNPSWFSSTGGGKHKVAGQDTSQFPVECVTWDDSKVFCFKVKALAAVRRLGTDCRLPSEAEWEYACRAGTTTHFHFGDQLNGTEANCDGRYPFGTSAKGPYLERTNRVGSYAANALGMQDMHGNVWEWCKDWYDDKYYANSPARDPVNEHKATARVIRGGSWLYIPRDCLAASRSRYTPDFRGSSLGFRLCVSAASRTQ